LGFRAAFLSEQVTTVWAPTGVAQAALLLGGLQLSPGVWLGAFAANVLAGGPLWTDAGIATGNTLEAMAAAWALKRFGRFDPMFSHVNDAIWFLAVAAVVTPMIAATIGTMMLHAAGIEPWFRFGELWREWWLGDALGALTVAPALLTAARARGTLGPRERNETALWVLLGAGVADVASTAFGDPSFVFLVFPFVIGAAVRLGQPAAALTVLTASTVIVWNLAIGLGSPGGAVVHAALVRSQVFLGVLAGSALLVAAAVTERRRIGDSRAAAYAIGGILSDSPGLDDAAPRILASICDALRWQIGAFWIVDGALNRLRCIAVHECRPTPAFAALTRETLFERGVGLPGRIWSSARAAWIENVMEDTNFPRIAVARKEGLHGAFGFPLLYRGDVVGVVEFFHPSAAAPEADQLETLSAIGSQIGQFVGRTRIETAAAEGKTRTRAIVETALDAIITMDHRGIVTEFNGAAERMFGYRREDAVGRELAALIIPPSLREGHSYGLARYLVTGEGPFIDRRVETMAVRSDGVEIPVEVSITRVPTEPPLFTGFVRDVTERRRFEMERQALLEEAVVARREAETANRAKDVFLATLSHELRTPLNAITGWTRMLLDNAVEPANTRKALEIVDRNAQVQLQLVTDILDVSRIITGKLDLDIGEVDLHAVIAAALDTVRPAADAKRVQLRSSLAPEARAVRGDGKRLVQVMWNLLSNAVKFTPEGGTVDVTLVEAGDGVRVTVADTGDGISPEFLPHVFDRFRQFDSSSTRLHGGLGLGLAIVRHLVELHRGTVRAESEGAGSGARFIVDLPRTV
jgi:PAS domain S-box-containing protein